MTPANLPKLLQPALGPRSMPAHRLPPKPALSAR